MLAIRDMLCTYHGKTKYSHSCTVLTVDRFRPQLRFTVNAEIGILPVLSGPDTLFRDFIRYVDSQRRYGELTSEQG